MDHVFSWVQMLLQCWKKRKNRRVADSKRVIKKEREEKKQQRAGKDLENGRERSWKKKESKNLEETESKEKEAAKKRKAELQQKRKLKGRTVLEVASCKLVLLMAGYSWLKYPSTECAACLGAYEHDIVDRAGKRMAPITLEACGKWMHCSCLSTDEVCKVTFSWLLQVVFHFHL